MVLYINFLTLNCNGIRNWAKRNSIFNKIRANKVDIAFLQETFSTPEVEYHWSKEWGNTAIWNSAQNNSKGVAILLCHNNIVVKKTMQDSSGRIIAADLSTFGENFHVVNVYAPVGGTNSPNDEQNRFYKSIYLYVQSAFPTILAGDFNCVDNPLLDRSNFNDKQVNKYKSDSLNEICNTFDFKDALRCIDPNAHTFTWVGPSVATRLDRFYVNEGIVVKACDTSHVTVSDHSAVTVNLEISSIRNFGKGYWKNNVSLFGNEELEQMLVIKWSEWIRQKLTYPDHLTWWNQIKKELKNLLITFSKKMISLDKKESQRLELELGTLVNDLANGKRVVTKFRKVKEEIRKREFQKLQAIKVRSHAENLDNNNKFDAHFFRKLKENRQKTYIHTLKEKNLDNAPLTMPSEKLKIAKKFYENLYSLANIEENLQKKFLDFISNKISDEQNDSLCAPVTKEEIEFALTKMQKGKTPGPDGLSAEFYKRYWLIIGVDFTKVVNEIFSKVCSCKNFNQGYITLVHKKSDPTDISNYRPITLLNVDYKIVSKVITNRLTLLMPNLLHDTQFAVRGRDVTNGLLLLRDTLSYLKSHDHEAYFVSIDLYKAFDCVEHSFLRKIMEKFGFAPFFCDLIAKLIQSAHASVIVNGYISDCFDVHRGVRQGDPLSLHLFLLFLEPLLKMVNHDKHIDVHHLKICSICR